MKHVTYGQRSLLMSDASAGALIDYAAALGAERRADTVALSAIGPEGDEVEVTFLLNASTALVLESTSGYAPPPANGDAVAYMVERTQLLRQPPPVQPQALDDDAPYDLSSLD